MPRAPEPVFTDTLELDMSTIEPSLAGPKRPQDRVVLSDVDDQFNAELEHTYKKHNDPRVAVEGEQFDVGNGDVVIAAITSCTNTSNPSVLVAAGLVARKARAKGLLPQPWVKTSLAPGSQVVTDYLKASGLEEDLDAMGFDLVGYGCTTCIGNSGPLAEPISKAINENDLVAVSVLSGNRNFEGRVSPDCRANYLASPPLVVAYALKGTVRADLVARADRHRQQWRARVPQGHLAVERGNPLADRRARPFGHVPQALRRRLSRRRALAGDPGRRRRHLQLAAAIDLHPEPALLHRHDDGAGPAGRHRAARGRWRCSANSITTDHISPAGAIKPDSPAGRYLLERQVSRGEFNSYGSRRGNHEVMMRGTFANIRIRNKHAGGCRGRLHALRRQRGETHGDLRRGHGVPAGRAPARDHRRQGIWHGQLARLGGEGHGAARRARGDRRKLRAHPPVEPGRHGRASAAVPGGRERRNATGSTATRNTRSPASAS